MSKASSKTNYEIISIIANAKGFSYNGENVHTWNEWKEKGFSVIKGEKAFIQTYLWTKGINKRFVPAILFNVNQVVKIRSKTEMPILV